MQIFYYDYYYCYHDKKVSVIDLSVLKMNEKNKRNKSNWLITNQLEGGETVRDILLSAVTNIVE